MCVDNAKSERLLFFFLPTSKVSIIYVLQYDLLKNHKNNTKGLAEPLFFVRSLLPLRQNRY